MRTHTERRILPYTAEQMFDLVADIDRYPEFLPWCVAARVERRRKDVIHADLVIGFKMIREHFGSKVTLSRPESIFVEPTHGPFRKMNNEWRFSDLPEGGCVVDFFVEFQFNSKLLETVMGALFNEAVRRMVAAFETRAQALYGAPDADPSPQAR